MANEQLLVTLGVQDKGATTQIRALNKELKSLDTQYKLASKSGDGFDKSVDGLQKKLGLLEQKLTAQTTKLNTYKKQMDEAKEGIQRKTEELEKLKNSQEDNTKSIAKTEKQLNTYRNQLKNAENSVKETEAQIELLTQEIENTNKAISNFSTDKLKKELKEAGKNLEELGDKFDKTGQTMNNIGNSFIGLSAPITAFAGYATKVSVDFESAMSNVQAISGATGEDLKALEDKAKEMGKTTSKSATDSANAFSYMALSGWDTQQMLDGIEPILRLAEAGNLDLALASDLTTDSLSALGLGAKDTQRYLDMLADAQASSNTTAQALMEAYIECGGSMRALNVPLQESTAWLGVLANRGLKGSQAGNSLNSVLINLTSGAGQAGEAMEQLGISAFDSEGNFIGIEATLRKVKEATKDLTEEEQNMYLSMLGGKTQITTLQALLAGLDEEYVALRDDVADSSGELTKMAETMQSNVKGNVEKLKSAMEGLGIQVGEKLLPHINSLIDKLSALIEWFGGLDEETQQTIIKMGLFATATGGALKVVGNLTSSVGGALKTVGEFSKSLGNSEKGAKLMSTGLGKVVTSLGGMSVSLPVVAGAVGVLSAGVYAYNEVQDAMNKSMVDAKEDMSLLEKATLGLQGVQAKSKDELIEMGLVYEDFNKNISSDFQDSVKEMSKDVQDFNLTLSQMNLDGVMSEGEVGNVLNRVTTLVDGIENNIRAKSSNVQNAIMEMYNSDGIIDESEQKLIEYWSSRTDSEVQKANDLENAIKDILNQAKGRELTSGEEESIRNYYAQLKQLELELQADNSYELEYAQQEFKNRLKTLDAEGASELLQQKYKQYEEEKIAIESHYDTLIAQVQGGNENLTAEDEKLIADLQAKKEEKLAINQQYWDEAYNYTVSSNENLSGVINKYNGEILNAVDQNYYERLVLAEQNLQGLNEITETGYQTMLDTTTGKYVDMYAVVDEKTGQLQGLYNINTGAVSAMSQESAKEIENLYSRWATSSDGIATKNIALRGSYIDTSNNIIDSNGRVIGSLGQVRDNTGKLQNAILDLNGNPIAVGSNADEISEKLRNTKGEVNNLDGSTATVKVDDGGSINSFGSRLKNMLSGLFGGGKSYAIGTSNAPQGIHTVNEKGWELIDAPQGKTAIGLSSGFGGDTAYLPQGTKVKTNLASTEMMVKEIKSEVSRQLGKIDYSNGYYNSSSANSTGVIGVKNDNSELVNSMNIMISLLNELVNKDTTIQMNGKVVAKMIANDVDEQISKRARSRF